MSDQNAKVPTFYVSASWSNGSSDGFRSLRIKVENGIFDPFAVAKYMDKELGSKHIIIFYQLLHESLWQTLRGDD